MSENTIDYQKVLPSFTVFKGFNKEELNVIIPLLEYKEFKESDVIFEEGQYGTHIFFLLEGLINIVKTSSMGNFKKIGTIQPLTIFGEMALMALIDGSKRSAGTIATTEVKTFALSRANFDKLTRKNHELAIKFLRRIASTISNNVRKSDMTYMDSITKEKLLNMSKKSKFYKKFSDIKDAIPYIPLLAGIDHHKLDNFILPMLEIQEFKEGEVIYNEGEPGVNLYVLLEGSVDIFKNTTSGLRKKIFTLYPFSTFGEMSLIDNTKHSGTIVTASDVKLFNLSKANFEIIIKEDPYLAINMLKCIARIISGILRRMNDFYVQDEY